MMLRAYCSRSYGGKPLFAAATCCGTFTSMIAVLVYTLLVIQQGAAVQIKHTTKTAVVGPENKPLTIETSVDGFDNAKHKVVLRWRRNFEEERETEMWGKGGGNTYTASIDAWALNKKDTIVRWFVKVYDRANNQELARQPKLDDGKNKKKEDKPTYAYTRMLVI
eukprot:1195664-Prorocentrum_minimum.AAC.8